uniref:Uncharacterized protein n=1 Tax=Tanacetum cinerariifolium TaxID=118510 RepID=A0A6L2P0N6_TANCI|nr:hypothetical protein [Tanacetum cinerariifolium]
MRRIGNGFSGVDTLLFDGMLVPQQAQNVEDAIEDEDDVNELFVEPTPPSPTLATPPPPPQQEHIPSPPQAETAQPSLPPQQQPSQTAEKSMTLLNKLLETCATLTKQVENLEQDKAAQAIEITKLKKRVKRGKIAALDANEDVTLETVDADVQGRLLESHEKAYHLDLEHVKKSYIVTTAATTITTNQVPKAITSRRRRGVIIQDPEEAATASVIMQSEVKSKDKGKGILVQEPKPLKRQAQIEQDKAFARQLEAELNAIINWNDVARKNMMVYLKNMVGFKMDFFKGMTYTNIRPIFEKHYNLNQDFLERVKEEVIGQKKEEGGKRKGEDLKQDAAKKQKTNKEIEELKTRLQIVPNDDDVYTKATPLELKVPVVDYQIHHEHNKPFYKIIKADENHQLFLSFITLLKNFDREDLAMLWKLVQEIFQSSEPKNFSDDFLLNTLKNDPLSGKEIPFDKIHSGTNVE